MSIIGLRSLLISLLDMSWNSGDFYNQQYIGPTSYELQERYVNGNFMPCSLQFNSQQFYSPNEYLSPTVSSTLDEIENSEPPLLEELGINFEHIYKKTKSVLNPFATPDSSILDDVDLAGPLVFCLAFAFSLLLLGKIHFGYVYGIVTLGTVGMYALLNLMASPDKPCSGIYTTSVLGYCLLPMLYH